MYQFKITPEIAWFVLTAVVGALAVGISSQGATPPTDWHAWGIGVVAAATRTVLGLLLAALSPTTPKP